MENECEPIKCHLEEVSKHSRLALLKRLCGMQHAVIVPLPVRLLPDLVLPPLVSSILLAQQLEKAIRLIVLERVQQ